MEFKNLTPFPVLNYVMFDKNDEEHLVVAMKTAYRLIATDENHYQVEVIEGPESPPLCFQDEYRKEIILSSVLQESDLAPFKPYCDIIINGSVYTPDEMPVTHLPVSVTLVSPEKQILLDKKLIVTGERWIQKKNRHWELTTPLPFTTLPLDWIYAFGGECRVNEQDCCAKTIPKDYCLSEESRLNHPDKENPPIAHTAYASNPIGCGYIEPWYLKATQRETFIAPRIEHHDHPFTTEIVQSLIKGNADLTEPVYQPAGFGIFGRSWQPRIAKAGTYDQQWLEHRHPYLPEDFDFAYWNAAPGDQQLENLPSGCTLTLSGFSSQGIMTLSLANHEALVLLRLTDGRLIPQRMKPDTLILNLDKKLITITWRITLSSALPIRVLEARYETEPERLIEKFFPFLQKKS